MIYRWKEREADLINQPNPWPVRIEFTLLAGCALLACGSYLYDRIF